MKKLILGFIILISIQNLFAKEKVIAKVPEASGIVYSEKSNTLFVVNDEGKIYELSTKGQILKKLNLGKYDLEGITIDEDKGLLILAIEGDEKILVLNQDNFKILNEIKIKRKYKKINVLKKDSKNGIEGIVLFKDKLYISNQSKNKYPKADSSVIVIVDYDLNKKKLKIKNIIDHGITDVSGLTFYKDTLFMISDKNNLLLSYDIKNNKIIKKYKLSKKYAQEGLTFDKKGNLYIEDDNGQILKIKKFDF
jgi:uncharacterized protein YjiK